MLDSGVCKTCSATVEDINQRAHEQWHTDLEQWHTDLATRIDDAVKSGIKTYSDAQTRAARQRGMGGR